MSSNNDTMLDLVFGPGEGTDEQQRAAGSSREFVRSLDQLAEASDRAKGRRLTASEALESYGLDVLIEVARDGSALLSAGPVAAGRLLRSRRELLGLDVRHVANSAKVTPDVVRSAEDFRRVPIRDVEKIARVLSLDERIVSWKPEATAENQHVAVRLRTIGEDSRLLTQHAVSAIAEAAWVASTQLRLVRLVGLTPNPHGIVPSANYGGPSYPPYKHGYFLAQEARRILGLGQVKLQMPLRDIAEVLLGIPVIQVELGPGIAGVTVAIGADRAIIINLDGANRNVFVRRSTVAHELGHLLYDPDGKLDALRVDDYEQLDSLPSSLPDPVEQRANAFGVEFIAPQDAVVDCYRDAADDGLWEVMNHFGVSFTAAKYQVWNGLNRAMPLESLRTRPGRRPDDGWEAGEAYTLDYHPLPNLRPSRAGRFSAVVCRAATEGIISWDSAAEMLESTVEQIQESVDAIRELFPVVFDE